MTHKKKDCMERPRKVGAKYSGANIAHDEYIQANLNLSYDGKRDRWSGYDPSEHKAIIEEFQKVEEAKRQLRADKLDAQGSQDDEDETQDEDKYVDEVDMPGTKVDSKQRITVRNLRIREDTAKYLRNLDPNSAYYDPKTRSMRENPNPKLDDTYAGENFVRFTGDTRKHATAQLFAWEAYEKGVDVHLLAEPTKLEMLQKEYDSKKEQFKTKVQKSVLEKYGGEEHLAAPPKSLLLAQTEDYVEYSRSGKIIKGQEKEVIRSKYPEDVYVNNHTTVWGSYWFNGRWGYKCCHSFIKNSYCLGEAGFETNSALMEQKNDPNEDNDEIKEGEKSPPANKFQLTEKSKPSGKPKLTEESSESSSSSSSSSESSEDEKSNRKAKKKNKKKKRKEMKKQKKQEDKLQKALREEEERQKAAEELLKLDERKRPYNSMYEAKKPTEEEIEAYYLKRRREEDPMNQFMS